MKKPPHAASSPLLRWLCATLCALLPALPLTLLPATAHAYTLSPLVQDFTPTGRGSRAVFVIDNDQATPVALEFSVKARTVNPNGEEVLTDAEDDFGVFPQQMILRPNQKQTVRVQWLGKNIPKKELQYRLVLEQLPVDTDGKPKEGVNIKFLMRYLAFMAVVPPGAKGKLVATSAEVVEDNKKRLLLVRIENQGDARGALGASALSLTPAAGAAIRIDFETYKSIAGESINAGAARIFRIEAPATLQIGTIPAVLLPPSAAAPAK